MLSFFPRGVLDEILNLIESVSEDFPSYSCEHYVCHCNLILLYTYIYLFRGCLDSAVGRSGGSCSARWCCRGREFDSHGRS